MTNSWAAFSVMSQIFIKFARLKQLDSIWQRSVLSAYSPPEVMHQE